MQDTVIETLEAAGFEHYEVSGYARPGKRCQHNLNYWQFGDYIACGAGAHSKITLTNDTIVRERRFGNPESFISHALAGNAVAENRVVEKDEQAFEFMLNVLRLKEGVDSTLLTQRTHLTMEDILENLNRARGLGLMPEGASRIKATGKRLGVFIRFARNVSLDVKKETTFVISLFRILWSGRRDSNSRPLAPHASALPGCATPRQRTGILH